MLTAYVDTGSVGVDEEIIDCKSNLSVGDQRSTVDRDSIVFLILLSLCFIVTLPIQCFTH